MREHSGLEIEKVEQDLRSAAQSAQVAYVHEAWRVGRANALFKFTDMDVNNKCELIKGPPPEPFNKVTDHLIGTIENLSASLVNVSQMNPSDQHTRNTLCSAAHELVSAWRGPDDQTNDNAVLQPAQVG